MIDSLWAIDATLKERGFSLVAPPSRYRGPIRAHGNVAIVEIDIPDPTFGKMPTVRVLDRAKLPIKSLAHINSDDSICYVGEGGLPLDLYNPGGSVLRVLREAEGALERSFGGRATSEFEAELASYWQGQTVLVDYRPGQRAEIARAELVDVGSPNQELCAIVPHGHWRSTKSRSRTPVRIISLPSNLRHSSNFGSDRLLGIVEWLESQTDSLPSIRDTIVSSAAESEAIFVIAPNALIGWLPEFPAKLRMLQRSGHARKKFLLNRIANSLHEIGLKRMTGIPCDLQHIVRRNLLDKPSLIGKRISLVGLGTIGGYLARQLVQAGAGCGETFSIYDPDILRPGNLGRHILNFSDLERPKSIAMEEVLKAFHPDIQIRSFPRNALDEWETLERSDLVIDATGDYNVATNLNHRYMSQCKGELALLHAWVYGNGIAAQSFLNLKDGLACYRCLNPIFGEPWRHAPVRDVKMMPKLAPAACGQAGYVPFASDAPLAAASLALRAVLDWAGDSAGQRLRTITLDYDIGKEVRWASPTRSKECPACGS